MPIDKTASGAILVGMDQINAYYEAQARADKIGAKISATEVTKGGMLLAVAGRKTRTIGGTKDFTVGEITFLHHGELKLPVVIDAIIEPKSFSALSDEEISAAGYTGRNGFLHRLAMSDLGKAPQHNGQALSQEDIAVAKEHIQNYGKFGQAVFHVATPQELKAAGYDGSLSNELANVAVEAIRTADRKTLLGQARDRSVERAEKVMGGVHMLDAKIGAGLRALMPKGRSGPGQNG